MLTKSEYRLREVQLADLPQLLELEKLWPNNARASETQLRMRIEKFPLGYLVGEDESGLVGSIISHPYHYEPNDLSNFQSWDSVVRKCYLNTDSVSEVNALYIVSGTAKVNNYERASGMAINSIVNLAQQMGMKYVVAGVVLSGYAKFLNRNAELCAEDYVFSRARGRFIEPLIEKYHHLGFAVPSRQHVIANYFPHEPSLNYSALVVRQIDN